MLVTDEDDCSIRTDSEEFFSQASTVYTGEVDRRCFWHKEAQTPIARYVDGFLAVQPNPERLVFATITGVPADLEGTTYDAMLDDPRMIETLDRTPITGGGILLACSEPRVGRAFPARRNVSTARDLAARGAQTSVSSICAENFTAPITAILRAIDLSLSGACS